MIMLIFKCNRFSYWFLYILKSTTITLFFFFYKTPDSSVDFQTSTTSYPLPGQNNTIGKYTLIKNWVPSKKYHICF